MERTVVDEATKGKILSEQEVDEKGNIINKYD